MPARTRLQAAREKEEQLRTLQGTDRSGRESRHSSDESASSSGEPSVQSDGVEPSQTDSGTSRGLTLSDPALSASGEGDEVGSLGGGPSNSRSDHSQEKQSEEAQETYRAPYGSWYATENKVHIEQSAPAANEAPSTTNDRLDAEKQRVLSLFRAYSANSRLKTLRSYVTRAKNKENSFRHTIEYWFMGAGLADSLNRGSSLEQICKSCGFEEPRHLRTIRRWKRACARKERLEKALKTEEDVFERDANDVIWNAISHLSPDLLKSDFLGDLHGHDRAFRPDPPPERSLLSGVRCKLPSEPSEVSMLGAPGEAGFEDDASMVAKEIIEDPSSASSVQEQAEETVSACEARELQEARAKAREEYLQAKSRLDASRNHYERWLKYYRFEPKFQTSEEAENYHLRTLADNTRTVIHREVAYDAAAENARHLQAMNTNSVSSRFPDAYAEEWQKAVNDEAEWSLSRLKPERIERWRGNVLKAQCGESLGDMDDAELTVRDEEDDISNLRGVYFGESSSMLAYSTRHGDKIMNWGIEAERIWEEMTISSHSGEPTEVERTDQEGMDIDDANARDADHEETRDQGKTGSEASSSGSDPYCGFWGVQKCSIV
ncbi:uncharacterized protein AB675_8272 [Cyphellophora attinorum]|uniref:Uncharacterized protein n=1 Tax=Cyphellophora attinorum TaxID=1664694 RepID=A0A0N0NQX9_9EURO|nr:uncharacterized protein AB675_8272 [Phialophora attinorum]KPI44438.1 hypothetical protein AB675_8272 [Phialophora attinorum]